MHYSSGHASKANDIELRNDEVLMLSIDTSASQVILGANDLIVPNGQGVVIGHNAQLNIGGQNTEFQMHGTGSADSRMMLGKFAADTTSGQLGFVKSRAAIGAFATIVTGDSLGQFVFYGDDGGDYGTLGARIDCISEGTIAGNRIPTKLLLQTGTDAGPSVVTTAVTIDSAQLVTVAAGITLTTGDLTLTALSDPIVDKSSR